MHVGSAEDTSVNLFKKSATLDEAQRAEFVQRLWERSAAKVDEPPKADSVSDTPSAQADGAAVGAAPVAAAQAPRAGMAHAVTKIDFDAVAGGGSPKGAASSPTFSSVKARAVKLEPSPVVPLARQEMVSSARPGRVGMTPSREDVAGGSPRVAIGETPNRDERLSLAAQSPSQHSACSSSIANSPHDCSNQSDAALAAPLAALPPECRDPGFRFRLRLIPRDPQLSQLISACGFNPMLELTFKPTKSIGSVVVHLIDKWGPKVLQELAARAQPGTPAPARVEFRLHSTRHPNHVGWGQLDKATTTAEVFDFAGRPVNFRLQYALVFDPPGVERGAPPPASRPALATSPKTHAVPAAPPQRPAPHACAGGPGVQPVQEPAPAAHEFVPFQRHRSGGEGGAQACGAAGRADGRAGGEGGAEALPREGADAVAGAGAGAGAQIDLTCHETLGPADSRGWSRGAHARRLDYAQGGHGGWPREETELFASILESRDGQPYSHFTGDSMDGLGLLLREDGSNSNGSNGGMSARAFFALAEISQGARPADFAPRAECSAGVKRAADGGADAIAQLEREKRARPL
jgi:hypothetical protein